ncbi:MAG: pyridoxine 5'-phosphate synthase [Planctomycetota bacterium]
MGTKLSVNVNKIAWLRNARDQGGTVEGVEPSVVAFAKAALDAGAAGITVHPRPDQRHIRISDVHDLAALLEQSEYADRELNIEGNPLDASAGPDGEGHLMPIIRAVKPDQVTLVPDAPGQATSDHGFDLGSEGPALRPIIEELKGLGCRVSVFMDPDPESMAGVRELGADRVELYTEPYASAYGLLTQPGVLDGYVASAKRCRELGLGVNAGHDLSLANLGVLLDAVRSEGGSEVDEVSIGQALVAECLTLGVFRVVRGYLTLCGPGSPGSSPKAGG